MVDGCHEAAGTSVPLVKSLPKVARDRLQRTIFVASGSMIHPTFLPVITFHPYYPPLRFPRHVLISPPCTSVSFFSSFLSSPSNEDRTSSRFVEMIAEAIIIEEFEYAFNAYPFIKVKQHLRKLDRFRIRPSGSRIIVLLPGN